MVIINYLRQKSVTTKNIKTGKFDLDDDLTIDDFNFDEIDSLANPEIKSRKRNPVMETFKGSISGAKSRLLEPSFIAKTIKDSLPEQYNVAFTAADKTLSTASSLYDEAVKEIKPQFSRLAKKVDRLVPENSKLLKKLTNKFDKFINGETSSYKQVSKEEFQDQSINASIAEIFKNQNEKDDELEARKSAKEDIKDSIDSKRFNTSLAALTSIEENTNRSINYTEKITQAYQKKSLELQFRSYFVQSELLKTSSKFFEVFNKQNESIVKNTALPEFVKIKDSEKFLEVSKGKFANSIHKGLFGDTNIIDKAMGKLRKKVSEQVNDFKSALEMGISGLEQIESLQEVNRSMQESGMDGLSPYELAGSSLGSAAGDWLGKKTSKFFRSKIQKGSNIDRFGYKAANFATNLSGKAKGIGESEFVNNNKYSGGAKGFAANAIRFVTDLFGGNSPDLAFDTGNSLKGLDSPSIFNNKTQKSITDIIPGYLARIQRELIITRTNNKNVSLELYDFKSDKFINKNKLSDKIKTDINEKFKNSNHGEDVENAINIIKGDEQIDDKDMKVLKEFISKLSTIDIDYNLKTIEKTNLFQSLPEDKRKLIKNLLNKNIENHNSTEEQQYKFTKSMKKVRHDTPDIMAEIEMFIKAGYSDILEEQGLIEKDDDGNIKVNDEAYFKLMRENTLVSSDKNVKTGVKGVTPKSALDAIKKTKIYNWLYKHGKGDTKRHVGPMAQDVNANMGEQAAPNGTAIDLTTMNGMNMAAIQALRDEQTKINKTTDNTTILKSIDKNVSEIYKAMKDRNIHVVDSSIGATGSKTNDNKSYKDIARRMLENTFDLATKAGSDLFSSISGAYKFGKDKVVLPAMDFISKKWTNNKDSIKSGFGSLLNKAGELASTVIDTSMDVIKNKLPAGFKKLAEISSNLKDAFMDEIYQPVDIYIRGKTIPAISARLLKLGHYFDQQTGKVITSFKDFKTLKGSIVDAAGNVVLTLEDIANGLFDKNGKEIDLKNNNIYKFLAKSSINIYKKAKDFALGSLSFMKDLNIPDKIKSFIPKGLFKKTESETDRILSDIREILIRYTKIKPKGFGKPKSTSNTGTSNPINDIKDKINTVDKKDKILDFFKSKDTDNKEQEPTNENRSGSYLNLFKNMTQNMKDKRLAKEGKEEDKEDISQQRYRSGNILDNGIDKVSGLLSKGKGFISGVKNGKGIKGKIFGGISSLFGATSDEEDNENTEPSEKKSLLQKIKDLKDKAKKTYKERNDEGGLYDNVKGKFKKTFNDRDGSGERDGSWKDRIASMLKKDKEKNKDVSKADLSQRYRSKENFLDGIMSKIGSLFSLMKGGISALFGTAGSLLSGLGGLMGIGGGKGIIKTLGSLLGKTIKMPFKALKGIKAASSFIGKPLVKGISALKNLPGAANVVSKLGFVRTALTVGSLATGGLGSAVMAVGATAISAVTTVLSSSVLIGAAAIAGAGYGAYRAYKYINRDKTNEFIDYRLKLYGLLLTDTDKHHVHEILELEEYLENEAIGFNVGKAYILKEKLDVEEIYSIMSIDKDDEERVNNFTEWFQTRFKPYFLTHLTALYAVNNKIKLTNITDLTNQEQSKFLDLSSFEDGPYDKDVSPFNDVDSLNTDKSVIDDSLNVLKEAIKKGFKNKQENKKAAPTTLKQPQTKNDVKKDNINKWSNIKPAVSPVTKFSANDENAYLGEDGDKQPVTTSANGPINNKQNVSIGDVKLAGGPLSSGQNASQFIMLSNGVKLDGVNPQLLKNFHSMAEEYGKITGRKLLVTDGFRTYQDQMRMYRSKAGAAKPGYSMHEKGLALDVSTADLNALEKLGLMRKYGFTRPVGGETWHTEPAGLQVNLTKARNDPDFASQAIAASLYKGGGGYGITSGAKKYGRNQDLAIKLLGISPTPITNKEANDNDYLSGSILKGSNINKKQSRMNNNIDIGKGMLEGITIKQNKLNNQNQQNTYTPEPSIDTETKPPVRASRPLFQSRENTNYSSNESSGLGSGALKENIDEVNNTLVKSLTVQTEMLKVLKQIANNVSPEQFNEIKKVILNNKQAEPNKNTSAQVKAVPSPGVNLDRRAYR